MNKTFPSRPVPNAPKRQPRGGGSPLAAQFGPLELQILECLWQRGSETSVRMLLESFPGAAYTTLMTTLDRLFKKGVLDRRLCNRAFLYLPRYTREGLEKHLAGGMIARLLGTVRSRFAARPILSTLVETVGNRDTALLDELEALIQAERLKGSTSSRGRRKR